MEDTADFAFTFLGDDEDIHHADELLHMDLSAYSSNLSTGSDSGRTDDDSTDSNNGDVPENTTSGRWSVKEHDMFLQGLQKHGKGWKKIAEMIQTRNVVQVRTHAQKYFQKLERSKQQQLLSENGNSIAAGPMKPISVSIAERSSIPSVLALDATSYNGTTARTSEKDESEISTIATTVPSMEAGTPSTSKRKRKLSKQVLSEESGENLTITIKRKRRVNSNTKLSPVSKDNEHDRTSEEDTDEETKSETSSSDASAVNYADTFEQNDPSLRFLKISLEGTKKTDSSKVTGTPSPTSIIEDVILVNNPQQSNTNAVPVDDWLNVSQSYFKPSKNMDECAGPLVDSGTPGEYYDDHGDDDDVFVQGILEIFEV